MSSTLHKSSPTVVGNKKSNIKMGENSIVKLYLLLYNLCEVVGLVFKLFFLSLIMSDNASNKSYNNCNQLSLVITNFGWFGNVPIK